jgi:bifunctional non-homologous end joining protein LigD
VLDFGDAPRAPMPRHVEPMLATPFPRPFVHPDWIFEVKWDGYRAIAEVEQGSVRLYSRNRLSLTERFRLIANSLAQLGRDAVLDGEVVVLDETGKAQFQLLQNRGRSGEGVLAYYCFDLLYLDGHDLRGLPLLGRKELLARVIAGLPHVRLSEHIRTQGTAFFAAAEKQGIEGIVAKLAESRYEAGQRSRAWLKIKTELRQNAVIGGYTIERGSRARLGALLLGVYADGELAYIGHTGTGFNGQALQDVRKRLEPLLQDACPFKRRPKPNAAVRWVKPELVCEVSFSSWTQDGLMRHPVFHGLKSDVLASSVRREQS